MYLAKSCKLLLCAAFAISSCAGYARAAPLTIDPNQSFLSLVVGGIDDGQDPPVFTPLTTPQVPGSDSTRLSGQLDAHFGDGTIWFLTSPGQIVFENQNDPMEPDIGGVLPGSAAANYGLIIDLQGLVTGPGAVRDVTSDLTSTTVPIVAGTFDSSAVTLSLNTGTLDVNLTGFTAIQDTVNISGNSGLNSDINGVVDIVGLTATVTIPIFVQALVPVEVSPGFVLPLTAIFEGQIVAVGQIPEPGSAVLLGMAGLGLAVVGVRHRRSRR